MYSSMFSTVKTNREKNIFLNLWLLGVKWPLLHLYMFDLCH